MWKQVGLLALVMAATGCYVYEPVRPSDAIMDARVRATVSPEKAAELSEALRGRSRQFTGKLAQRDGEGLLLEVPLYSSQGGMSMGPLNNRVYVPFSDLITLESRKLSAWRTGLVVGALVAGVTTTWVVVGGTDTVDDKPKTDVDNAVILRIPIGIF